MIKNILWGMVGLASFGFILFAYALPAHAAVLYSQGATGTGGSYARFIDPKGGLDIDRCNDVYTSRCKDVLVAPTASGKVGSVEVEYAGGFEGGRDAYARLSIIENGNVLATSERVLFYCEGLCSPNPLLWPKQQIPFLGANQITLLSGHTYTFRFMIDPDVSGRWWMLGGPTSNNGTGSAQSIYFVVNGEESTVEPVIIVPGIMGTRLNRASDGEEVWPNIGKMSDPTNPDDNYLNDLILSNSGNPIESTKIFPTSILDQMLTFPVYKNIIEEFTRNGYVENENLFLLPYDWRLDIKTQVSKLNEKIQQALEHSPTGKINIVAHSMGGLLTKEYLRTTTSTNFLNKLVFAGVPQLGAPKALKILNYGDDMDIRFLFLGLNPNKIKEISQNMPAVYQLLPTERYINANGGYIKDFRSDAKILNYNETTAFMLENQNDTRNPLLLNNATAFHETLDNFVPTADHIYNIVGCRNPKTIGNIRIYPNDKYDIDSISGDGTVPFTSAMNLANNFTNYFVNYEKTGINHNGLVSDGRTVDVISNLVRDTTVGLSNGLSEDTAECFSEVPPNINETTIRFSTHSPVALHVYDAAGNHVGPLANGDVELGIPGSEYTSIGENNFAFVPNGNYRVVIDALSSGSFDLKTKLFKGSNVSKEVTYLSVPLLSSSTQAELHFSSFETAPNLLLDTDGNGTTDINFSPAAILSETQSTDITPPTITANVSSTIPLQSSIVFNFSAIDDLSGVAILRGTLDGASILPGERRTISTLGRHILHIEAVDKAGNLAVKDISFDAAYNFGGFLPPIETDGDGIYKLGRTLPIKFQLRSAMGAFVTNAVAKLSFKKVSSGIEGDTVIALSTSAANIGDQFRYDTSSNAYIFNLATNNMSLGTWQLRVDANDGKWYTVHISIK